MIVILTGASGVGKTSIVNFLESKIKDSTLSFFKFDSIGVPSQEDMIKKYGSPSEWQRSNTFEWIESLVSRQENSDGNTVLEGQMHIDYIIAAFESVNFHRYEIILIDCERSEMNRRLIHERNQSELANKDMGNWLLYLRKLADKHALKIIKTNDKSIEQTSKELSQYLEEIGAM